jgi:predicted HicB family RNase H-like nuclease
MTTPDAPVGIAREVCPECGSCEIQHTAGERISKCCSDCGHTWSRPNPNAYSDQITAIDVRSGKILLRLPRSLHASLIDEAIAEGTSLNQLILSKLSVPLRTILREQKNG